MNAKTSAKCTLYVSRTALGAAVLLGIAMPWVLRWYQTLRELGQYGYWAILLGYYLCLPGVVWALLTMGRLVENILEDQVFTAENVRYIRRIRWCCAWVSLVCLPASVFYPPLCFMTVIMAFLALTVSLVKNVMAAAVALREENDLTV